jgi:glycosyltransferase involved in cell wall biosynthesis
MAKTIWIINDYAGSPYHGMVFRHYYLAKEWVKKGYKVYIISATYSHYFKKLPISEKNFNFENIDGINYLWIRVPSYNNSTDKRRVLKWFVFSFKLLGLLFNKKIEKPDVIIASPTAPFLVLPAYILAKKFKAKFIFEIRDIWPLSIVELGNISSNHPLIKIMSWCEKFAIKKADIIVSSLQNYHMHLKDDLNLNRDFVWINNGIDIEEMKEIEFLPKEIENKIPKDKFIVGYTGTIGIANALEHLIEAGKLLKDYNDILILIVGEGGEKEKLKKLAEGYDNIKFLPAIPKRQVQSLLSLVDVCYIGWKNKKLYKYGVSPNKIFDYMYIGKPIIHSINTKNDIVTMANCGLSVEAENPKEIAKGVLKLYNMPKEERIKLGENGKKFVLENFTYEKLAKKYKELF